VMRCIGSANCTVLDEVWDCGPLNMTCSTYRLPSLGTLLNDNATSPLAMSALNVLVAMHLIITINTSIMVRDYSPLALLIMFVMLVALYVTLYVSFIAARWYVSIVPVLCLALWCSVVTYGLFQYYRRMPSKPLFWVSLGANVAFALAALIYIGFSPVPYSLVPGRDVVILVAQLVMALSCVVFVVSVAFHTRCVSYLAQVSRTYIIL